jgi:NAD(P)H-nitrite reductase large subunit
MDAEEEERRNRAVIESYKVVCICNKIRRGVVQKAIDQGASSIDDIRRRTRAATGPCGSKRCGPVIRKMLRER